MIFRDRNLNIAILISTSWHLACIFLITPTLISGDIRKNSTRISFLGSILERIVALPEKSFIDPDNVSLLYKIERLKGTGSGGIEATGAKDGIHTALTPPEAASKGIGAKSDKESFVFFEDKHAVVGLGEHYKRKIRPLSRFRDVLVTGEVRDRSVLYKPDLSKVLIFPSYFSSDYRVTVRFEVSRHGFVEKAECIASSGSSEVDHMALRYIRRWQFVPRENEPGDAQEGIARVSFSNR